MIELIDIEGFEWDVGNLDKNYNKHGVINKECEEVFKNNPLYINHDLIHSTRGKQRYQALGKTNTGRNLFLSFTVRKNRIRIISARDMSKNERKKYNEN
ncbi:MAG: BrnT family toxin [Ignavibacteria bacterium]|nr:BrnT family toxin [Ignavibacteria bacterium]